MRDYVLQMVLPRLRRALLALAMVLGASGALFAGTPFTTDVDNHALLFTAPAPFGWASAVGDFDRDGQLDVAVADPSFDLRVTDVDDDGDLDILIARLAGGDVIGIWVNAGDGRFRERAIHRGEIPTLPWSQLDRTPPGAGPAAPIAVDARELPFDGIVARVAAPSPEDPGFSKLLNAPGYRTPCEFPSFSRPPPAAAPIV